MSKESSDSEIQLPPKAEDLGYISLPTDYESVGIQRSESSIDKLKRKCGENPAVPLGLGLTTFALTFGLFQMRTGNKVMSQKMMRLRVFAQGFTIFALLGGVAYEAHKKSQQKALIAAAKTK